MEFISIAFRKLHNAAHIQCHTEIHRVITNDGAQTLNIAKIFDGGYSPALEAENAAFKKITKSAFTEKLQEADSVRDDSYNGLVEASNAYLKNRNPKKQDAARRLEILYEGYGSVSRKPLNEETANILDILDKLRGKYAEDVKLLNLEEWVSDLNIANKDFEVLMNKRYEETAGMNDVTMKEARKAADEEFKKICRRIYAFMEIEGTDKYESFIKRVNAVLAKYKVVRQSTKQNVEENINTDGDK